MPSIWITSKSRLERSDAIHSFMRAADSATNRRETADFVSPAPVGAGTSPSGSLQTLLECDRKLGSQMDAVVARRVSVDPEKVQVTVDRREMSSTLAVDI